MCNLIYLYTLIIESPISTQLAACSGAGSGQPTNDARFKKKHSQEISNTGTIQKGPCANVRECKKVLLVPDKEGYQKILVPDKQWYTSTHLTHGNTSEY